LRRYLPERLRGRSVLEVACGTGYWTQFLAPAVRRLVATDALAEPLALARLRSATGAVIFAQGDAYRLPPGLGLFDGAFAGLWLSHVAVQNRSAFLKSLHCRLLPCARVLLLDNSTVQCREHPIVDTDALGNTYQRRTVCDGRTFRILKNFPTEQELRALVSPFATSVHYVELENFWLLEYEASE